MTCCNVVNLVMVYAMLNEALKLNLAIARNVRVGRVARLIGGQKGSEHVVPVLPDEFHLCVCVCVCVVMCLLFTFYCKHVGREMLFWLVAFFFF